MLWVQTFHGADRTSFNMKMPKSSIEHPRCSCPVRLLIRAIALFLFSWKICSPYSLAFSGSVKAWLVVNIPHSLFICVFTVQIGKYFFLRLSQIPSIALDPVLTVFTSEIICFVCFGKVVYHKYVSGFTTKHETNIFDL